MKSALVAFDMTEWLCIAIAMHIFRCRLSKQVSLWTYVSVICQIKKNCFQYTIPGIQGSFSKDNNLDLDETIVEGEQNMFYKKVRPVIRYRLGCNL